MLMCKNPIKILTEHIANNTDLELIVCNSTLKSSAIHK